MSDDTVYITPRHMDSAPRDKEILLYCERFGWRRGEWSPDRYNKHPRPYWSSDAEALWGKNAVRENQPVAWLPLPPAPDAETFAHSLPPRPSNRVPPALRDEARDRLTRFIQAKREVEKMLDVRLAEKFEVTPEVIKKAYMGYHVRALDAEEVALVKALYEERCKQEQIVAANTPPRVAEGLGVSQHWAKDMAKQLREEGV